MWYNQYKETTHSLSTKEKLRDLKSLLRGAAAEFVFGQLSSGITRDYGLLKRELWSRFQKVENPRIFRSLFTKRSQKPGETVEDFAAELKRLYDKAHPGRDKKTLGRRIYSVDFWKGSRTEKLPHRWNS